MTIEELNQREEESRNLGRQEFDELRKHKDPKDRVVWLPDNYNPDTYISESIQSNIAPPPPERPWYSKLFGPSDAEYAQFQDLKNKIEAAQKSANPNAPNYGDAYKFGQPLDQTKLVQALALGELVSQPNSKGGYDIFRTYNKLGAGKQRETLPLAEVTTHGLIQPIQYEGENPVPVGAGLIPKAISMFMPSAPLPQGTIEQQARHKTVRELEQEGSFWKNAVRDPIDTYSEQFRNIFTGNINKTPEYSQVGEVGGSYESGKGWGEMVNKTIPGIAAGVAGGMAGLGLVGTGALVGSTNIPEYLQDWAVGRESLSSAMARSALDETTSILGFKLMAKFQPAVTQKLLQALGKEGNVGWDIIKNASIRSLANSVQEIAKAEGKVLLQSQLPVAAVQSVISPLLEKAAGHEIGWGDALRNGALNVATQMTFGLAMDLALGAKAFANRRGLLPKDLEAPHTYNMASPIEAGIREQQRLKAAKLFNYVSENSDKIFKAMDIEGPATPMSVRLNQVAENLSAAQKSGQLDNFTTDMLRELEKGGVIRNKEQYAKAKALVENVRDANLALDPNGVYKFEMNPVTGRIEVKNKNEKIADTYTAETTSSTSPSVLSSDLQEKFNQKMREGVLSIADKDKRVKLAKKLKEDGLITTREDMVPGSTKMQKIHDFVNSGDANNPNAQHFERFADIYKQATGGDLYTDLQDPANQSRVANDLLDIIQGEYKNPAIPPKHNDALVLNDGGDELVRAQRTILARNELGNKFDEQVARVMESKGLDEISAQKAVAQAHGYKAADTELRAKFIDKYTKSRNSFQTLDEILAEKIDGIKPPTYTVEPTTEAKPATVESKPVTTEEATGIAGEQPNTKLKSAADIAKEKAANLVVSNKQKPLPTMMDIANRNLGLDKPQPTPIIGEKPVKQTESNIVLPNQAEKAKPLIVPEETVNNKRLVEQKPFQIKQEINKANEIKQQKVQQEKLAKEAPLTDEETHNEISKGISQPDKPHDTPDAQSVADNIKFTEALDNPLPKAKATKTAKASKYDKVMDELKSKGSVDEQGRLTSKATAEDEQRYGMAQAEKIAKGIAKSKKKEIVKETVKTVLPSVALLTAAEFLPDDSKEKDALRAAGIFGLGIKGKKVAGPMYNYVLMHNLENRTNKIMAIPKWFSSYFSNAKTPNIPIKYGHLTFPEDMRPHVATMQSSAQFDPDVKALMAKHPNMSKYEAQQKVLDSYIKEYKSGNEVTGSGITDAQRTSTAVGVAKRKELGLDRPAERLKAERKGYNVERELFIPKIKNTQAHLERNANKTEIAAMYLLRDELHYQSTDVKNKYQAMSAKERTINVDQYLNDLKKINTQENIEKSIRQLWQRPDVQQSFGAISDAQVKTLARKYDTLLRPYMKALAEHSYAGATANSLNIDITNLDAEKIRINEGLAKAAATKKELNKYLKMQQKLAKDLEASPDAQAITKKLGVLANRIEKAKLTYDGFNEPTLRRQKRVVDNYTAFLRNSELMNYISKTTTNRGEDKLLFPYMAKIVEATDVAPKVSKIEERLKALYTENPDVANPSVKATKGKTEFERKSKLYALRSEELQGEQGGFKRMYDMPEHKTDMKIVEHFKSDKERQKFIKDFLDAHNPTAVNGTDGNPNTTAKFYEIDAYDRFGNPLKDKNGKQLRRIVKVSSDIDLATSNQFTRMSKEGLITKLHQMTSEIARNPVAAQDTYKQVVDMTKGILDTPWADADLEGHRESLLGTLEILMSTMRSSKAANAVEAIHEAIANMTHYSPPDYMKNKNYRGWQPRTKEEWYNLHKNYNSLSMGQASNDLHRGYYTREIDKQLNYLESKGIFNDENKALLEMRARYHSPDKVGALFEFGSKGAKALKIINALNRFALFNVLGINEQAAVSNHLFGVADMFLAQDYTANPIKFLNMLRKSYYGAFKVTEQRAGELVQNVKNNWKKSGGDLAETLYMSLDKWKPYGKNELKNDIMKELLIRKVGGDVMTSHALGSNEKWIEKAAYLFTRGIEHINRNMAAMLNMDGVIKLNPKGNMAHSDYVNMIADELQMQMSKSQGQYTLGAAGVLEAKLLKSPWGRMFMTLQRPWLHHMYNVHSEVRKAIFGDIMSREMGKGEIAQRLPAIAKLGAYISVVGAVGGAAAIPFVSDALKLVNKVWKDKDTPGAIRETSFDVLTKRIHEIGKANGLSNQTIDNLILSAQEGILGPLGIHLGMNESLFGMTKPFIISFAENAYNRLIKAGEPEEKIDALMKMILPVQFQRIGEAGMQLAQGHYMNPVTYFGDKKSNILYGNEMNTLDAFRYANQGKPPYMRAAKEASIEGTEMGTSQGKRDVMQHLLGLVDDKMLGLPKGKGNDKGRYVNNILNTFPEIIQNARQVRYDITNLYKSEKMQNAVEKSTQMIKDYIDKYPEKISQAALGTKQPITDQWQNKEPQSLRQNLENAIKGYYASQSANIILGQYIPSVTRNKFKLQDNKKATVKDIEGKKKLYLYKIPFEQQGFYKAWSTLVHKESDT